MPRNLLKYNELGTGFYQVVHLVFLLILGACPSLSAQNTEDVNGDSLAALYDLGARGGLSEDSALVVLKRVVDLAKEQDDYEHLAKGLNSIGVSYHNIGKLDSALAYYNRATALYKENADSSRLIRTYRNLIIIDVETGRYSRARARFDTAMLYVGDKDLDSQYRLNDVVIYLFQKQEKYEESLEFAKANLRLGKEMESVPNIAYAYNYIGDTYNNMERYDSSILYFKKAAELFKNSPDQIGYSTILTSLGGNLMQLERYEEAIVYLQEGEKIKMEVDNRDLCSNLSAQALTHYHLGDREQAMVYVNKIDKLGRDVLNSQCLYKAFYTASRVCHYLGEDRLAYEYLQKHMAMRDSQRTVENNALITDLEKKLELKSKEAVIAEKDRDLKEKEIQRVRLLGYGGLILLLITGVYLAYYWNMRREKQKKELLLEKNRMEKEALRELTELRTQFFTNISHELKTPLTLISGPLGEALEKVDTHKPLYATLSIAERNSRKLLDLVNEILQLAKLESGQIPVQIKPVEIIGYTRRLFTSFDSYAQTQQIAMHFNADVDALELETDTDHYERIISNLVSNALKYTPAGGEVVLDMMVEEGDQNEVLSVKVRDTGKGIDKDRLELIFERFYQTEEVKGEEKGGVGIGLSLAAQLAGVLKGHLGVESARGEGSVFTFSLPVKRAVVVDQASDVQATNEYHPNIEEVKESTILVVEDNADMQEYLKSLLDEHFNIEQATDGYDALQKLQKKDVDLIMSDIMMPKMDGYRLREMVLELDRYKRKPFLFLSARSLEEDVMRGFSLGVDDYITKPFNANALIARISNLLQNNRERQKHASEVGLPDEKELTQLQRFENLVRERLDDSGVKVADLAEEMLMSERTLRRLTKAETGLSPVELILEMRLLKARSLLESKRFSTVAEVMYRVGLESPSYFSKKYTERFGVNPSHIL